ncbi:MAG: hypothetical protein P4L03_02445 [Terracidiphilus sp.]|nr:hypothetical protein [Terracidiphilus sp.]
MRSSYSPRGKVAFVFWILALAAIPIWWNASKPGWDAQVYARAMHWVAAGQDPYAEGLVQEEAYYTRGPQPGEGVPFAYVYSPMTLPLLKLASAVPVWLLKCEYWVLYALCSLAMVLVGMRAAEGSERKWIAMLAPAALFFPGLLVNDVIQSGNLAYILYGLVLASAYRGLRSERWGAFYVAVVAASCFKAPYLCLLAIPVFSSRRQSTQASLAAAMGVGLFAVQPWIWPSAFHNYLRAVEMQFVWNRDFGASPAGQFGALVEALHLPFELASWVFYASYALPVLVVLMVLGRRYQRGEMSLGEWMPMVIVGTILLNPRHIEYDLAPLTLPMALIGLRLARGMRSGKLIAGLAFEHFVAINVALVLFVGSWWRPAECVLVLACFAAGSWQLLKKSEQTAAPKLGPVHETVYAVHELAS